MLSRTLASGLLLVALAAAPALAQETPPGEPPAPEPGGKLTPPAGWQADVGRSKGLELAVGREDHFGGVDVHVSAQHLRAPQPGGILLTQEIATVTLPADPALAATTELHGVHAGVVSLGDTVKIARWEIKPDDAARVTEAALEWSDASLGTTTISRSLVFQTGDHLVRLTAECIIAADAGALRGPCEAALATLAPLADAGKRVAVPVSDRPPAVEPPRPEGGIPRDTGPQMRELEGEMPVTILVDKPAKKADRRPYYVFGGLVIILAAYLINRRSRQRLEERAKVEVKDDKAAESPKDGESP